MTILNYHQGCSCSKLFHFFYNNVQQRSPCHFLVQLNNFQISLLCTFFWDCSYLLSIYCLTVLFLFSHSKSPLLSLGHFHGALFLCPFLYSCFNHILLSLLFFAFPIIFFLFPLQALNRHIFSSTFLQPVNSSKNSVFN